jgi:hypothetical protein
MSAKMLYHFFYGMSYIVPQLFYVHNVLIIPYVSHSLRRTCFYHSNDIYEKYKLLKST